MIHPAELEAQVLRLMQAERLSLEDDIERLHLRHCQEKTAEAALEMVLGETCLT